MSSPESALDVRAAEMEYTTLRTEILKRIELRYQIVAVTLTLAGVFLGVGLTKDLVALIYPPLATFLALAWAQNEFRIRLASIYIRERIEGILGLCYERWVHGERRKPSEGLGSWSLIVVSHGGVFLLTQLMAIGVEFSKITQPPFSPLKWVLIGFDGISVSLVLSVMYRTGRKKKQQGQ